MIAMQYTIRLASDFDRSRIRDRVKARAPLFAELEGLVHKSYLFNPDEGLYAPFYIWAGEEPAFRYLTGPLFQDLVDTFGRPRVRSWTVLDFSERSKTGLRNEPARCLDPLCMSGDISHAMKEVDIIPPEERLESLVARERADHKLAMEHKGIGLHMVAFDPDRWELIRYSTWAGVPPEGTSRADLVESYKILTFSHVLATD